MEHVITTSKQAEELFIDLWCYLEETKDPYEKQILTNAINELVAVRKKLQMAELLEKLTKK